jgi:hypothetical protein
MIGAEESRRQCGWRETCVDAEVDRERICLFTRRIEQP